MSEFSRSYRSNQGKRMPSEYPGPSCLDMTGSIRPKIFLLVKKITEAVNTEAQLFDGLGLQNQLTMQIIINFLDLKRGEIWIELLGELQEENFILVPSDQRSMEHLVKISKNKAAAVVETQRYLIRRNEERDEIQEREFYNVMQKCHLQNHLKALREAEFNARTTNYTYLVECRLWQKTQLQSSVMKAAKDTRVHRTTDGPLNVTVWPTKIKAIETEPPKVEEGVDELGAMLNGDSSMFSMAPGSVRESFMGTMGASMLDIRSGTSSRRWSEDHSLNISLVTGDDLGATPQSAQGGFYQVSADVLRKALQLVLAKEKKKGWLANVDDENYWRVRAKWRQDWYPEEKMKKPLNFPMHS